MLHQCPNNVRYFTLLTPIGLTVVPAFEDLPLRKSATIQATLAPARLAAAATLPHKQQGSRLFFSPP